MKIMKLPELERKFSLAEIGERTAPLKKADLSENPFRKEIRRLSTISEPILSSQTRKRASTDLSSSREAMNNVGEQRRKSLLTFGTKRSLRSVGARVANIIRVKNVMSRFRRKVEPQVDEISDEVFEIKEMPKEPRFASTLSPEAQYATMKGYEDVMYQNLCQLYPENLPKIRRNKTPLPGVTIRIGNQNPSPKSRTEARITTSLIDVSKAGTRSTSVTETDSSELLPSTPIANVQPTKLFSPGYGDENSQTSDPLSRRIINENAQPSKPLFPKIDENSLIQPENAEAKSLDPETNKDNNDLIASSKEKQLVLTYRYQRAMDLLDVLRKGQGLYSLSPRTSLDEKVEPLKEYNNWAYVWTHHFEKKNAKSARKLDYSL